MTSALRSDLHNDGRLEGRGHKSGMFTEGISGHLTVAVRSNEGSARTLLIAFDPPERLVPVELLFHYSVEERGVDPPALIILCAFISTVIKDLSTEAVQQEHEVTAGT